MQNNSILTAGDSRPCGRLTSCFTALPNVTIWRHLTIDFKIATLPKKVGLGPPTGTRSSRSGLRHHQHPPALQTLPVAALGPQTDTAHSTGWAPSTPGTAISSVHGQHSSCGCFYLFSQGGSEKRRRRRACLKVQRPVDSGAGTLIIHFSPTHGCRTPQPSWPPFLLPCVRGGPALLPGSRRPQYLQLVTRYASDKSHRGRARPQGWSDEQLPR